MNKAKKAMPTICIQILMLMSNLLSGHSEVQVYGLSYTGKCPKNLPQSFLEIGVKDFKQYPSVKVTTLTKFF